MSETSESLEMLSDILYEPLHNSILNSAEQATSPSRQIWDVIPTIENDAMNTGEPVAHQSLFVTPEPEESDNTDRLLSTPVPRSWSTDIKRFSSVSLSHINVVVDDDEDLNMIKEEDCMPSARENLRSLPSFASDNDKISMQEKLPKPQENTSVGISRAVAHNTTLLTQKALLQKRWAKNQNECSKILNSASQTLTGGLPKRPMRPIKPVDLDEAAELAILMKRGSEENAWMVNENENDEDQNELENLKARKREIKRRKIDGKSIENDGMQLLRVNELIATITRRQERANQHGSASLNIIDSELEERNKDYERDQSRRRERYNQMEEDVDLARAVQKDFDRECAPKKAQIEKGLRRPRGKLAKTAAEFTTKETSKKREREFEKQRNKRNRQALLSGKGESVGKGRGSKSKQNGNGKQKKKPGHKKVEHPSRMKNGRGVGKDHVMQKLFESLLPNDAIADRVAREDYGAAPIIRESVKSKQMKALLSSVPDSYDSHRKKVDKRDIKRASERFGFGNVKAHDGMWMLKGMLTPLYHHQLLAADFMVSRELATVKPYGGLLADAMGLGKTLETLATMVGNPPSPEDLKNKIRTTLIIVPSGAIRQWEDEIKRHVNAAVFKNVFHYKASKNIPMSMLENCDVIITSYAEVMASYPFPKGDEIKNLKGGLQEWLSAAVDQRGVLHKIEFYRVVLDEAQAIKNFKCRTSLACISLNGRFRWALSGTPIQNRLEELYPYFKFLRADWAKDYQEFRRLFCDPDADDASLRITVLLSICMIRRTMDDKILGHPIVELPKPHPETMHVELSRHERALYRILEDRFRDVMNEHLKQGTAEKNYCVFLVQLLRLRQCVAHPFLLEQTIKDIFTSEDLARLKINLRSCNRRDTRPIYEQMSVWIHEKEEQRTAAMTHGENPQDTGFGRSEFGKHFRMETFLKSLDGNDSKKMMERVVCRICGDIPQDAVITECNHVFCGTCLENYLHEQAAMIDDQDDEYTECPACRRAFSGFQKYNEISLLDDDEAEQGSNESSSQKNGRQSNRRKGHKDGGPCIKNSKWLNMCIADKNMVPLPSAKTVALKAQILRWFADSPDDKILIFTQFRMMARIVGLIAEKEKWGHVYYTGDMNIDQRHDAVQKFHEDPNIRIMIAGLKCGGQALNLTCANRCISLDLWWNHSVEMQGFGRIFRIGQRKETYFIRIVVRDTVDTRMLDMQSEKINAIDRAMQDTGRVVEPLSMQDLASLFGHLVTDDDGTWRVERDYEVDDEPTSTPETEDDAGDVPINF